MPLVLVEPRIARPLAEFAHLVAQFLHRAGGSRIAGDIPDFVRIAVQVVQLLGRTLEAAREVGSPIFAGRRAAMAEAVRGG